MTERTVFECDVSGERFGARNDVFELGVKRRPAHDPFKVSECPIHLSDDAVDDSPASIGVFSVLRYVAVESGEIVGVGISTKSNSHSNDRHVEYRDRDRVTVSTYEPFLEWLEEEVPL